MDPTSVGDQGAYNFYHDFAFGQSENDALRWKKVSYRVHYLTIHALHLVFTRPWPQYNGLSTH